MKIIQHTRWEPARELLESVYGTISYENWCKAECQRITAQPGRVAEVRYMNLGNFCALFVNDVAEH